MKASIIAIAIVGACTALLAAKPFTRVSDEAAALRRAGALLWEMSERYHEFSDRRHARRITPAAIQKMTDELTDRLTKNRDALERVLPSLSRDSRFALELTRFLQKWPNRETFHADLLLPPSTGAVGVDIVSLAMQVRDTRRGWKTLFPFFRP